MLKDDHNCMIDEPLEALKPRKKTWKLLFDPEEMVKEHEKLSLDDFSLDHDQL